MVGVLLAFSGCCPAPPPSDAATDVQRESDARVDDAGDASVGDAPVDVVEPSRPGDTADYQNLAGTWDVPGADGLRWTFEAVSHCVSVETRADGGNDASVAPDASACSMYQLCAAQPRPSLFLILFGPTPQCYVIRAGAGEPPTTYSIATADPTQCLQAGIACGAFADASSPPESRPERAGMLVRVTR